MGTTKFKYLTNFGIALYFKSLLVERLKESTCYIVSFDESLNDMISLLVRYFDETESKIKVRFCDAQFFFQGTLLDLQKQFNKTVKELDPNK